VFLRAVWRSSLRRVSSPAWVMGVCQVRSPRRSANWSRMRRVSVRARLSHWADEECSCGRPWGAGGQSRAARGGFQRWLEGVDHEIQRFALRVSCSMQAGETAVRSSPAWPTEMPAADDGVLDQIGRIKHQTAAPRLAMQHGQPWGRPSTQVAVAPRP
jgi:hypothetical protein